MVPYYFSFLNKGSTWGRFQNPDQLRYLSLVNIDVSMKKTPKIKLLVELVSRVASVKLASIYVMIIGQMFFLHLLADPQPAIWLNSSVYSWLSLFTNKS